MTNDEIFARIASDVADVANSMFGVRDITIWMTKDLFNRLLPEMTKDFNRLLPEQFILQKGCAMTPLFGCKIRVVLSPCNGMRWIVGCGGTAKGGEE